PAPAPCAKAAAACAPGRSSRARCSCAQAYRRDFRAAALFRTLGRRCPAARPFRLGTLAAPAPAAPAARAADLDSTQRVLARAMTHAGANSGAYVVDLGTGQELYSLRADTPRMPASVEKLYTSSTALLQFGADGHLTTNVMSSE